MSDTEKKPLTYAEREAKILELRAQHGEIEILELRPEDERSDAPPDCIAPPVVVLRAMALDAFVELQHLDSQRNQGVDFANPRQITRPLLECVVMGLDEAEAELVEAPMFEQDMMSAIARLAGAMQEDISVEPVNEIHGKGPIKIAAAGVELEFKRMSSFDYSRARSEVGKHRAGLSGFLSPLALLAIVRNQAIDPQACEALLKRYPAIVQPIGQILWVSADSRARRRQGK